MSVPSTTSPAKEILAALDPEGLRKRLLDAPYRILGLRKAEAEARKYLQEAESNLKAAEAVILAEVQMAENKETGKPKFSNAEARQAEVTRRIHRAIHGPMGQRGESEVAYQRAYEAYRKSEQRLQEATFARLAAEEEFSALRAASRVMASELALLAGDPVALNGEV